MWSGEGLNILKTDSCRCSISGAWTSRFSERPSCPLLFLLSLVYESLCRSANIYFFFLNHMCLALLKRTHPFFIRSSRDTVMKTPHLERQPWKRSQDVKDPGQQHLHNPEHSFCTGRMSMHQPGPGSTGFSLFGITAKGTAKCP